MTGKIRAACIGLMIVMSGFGGLFLMSQPASAVTIVPAGNVSGTWNTSGSPYYITGSVMVSSIDKLEIIPDTGPVDIVFAGNYGIFVQGNLYVNGTTTNRVRFTSNSTTPARGDWTTITSQALTGNIRMRNATIEYAATGLNLETNGNVIQDTEILECAANGIYSSGGNNNFINRTYIHNISSVGIWLLNSAENNTINDCNISYANQGIYVNTNSHNTSIVNISMYNIGTTGIQIQASNDCKAMGGKLTKSSTGIYLLNSNRATITGMNISEQTSGSGLALNNAHNNTAENIEYYHCGLLSGSGIAITTGSRDNYFANSSIIGNHFGIDIYLTSMWNTVYNNTFAGNNLGMSIWQTSHNNTVAKNTFLNHPNYALDLNAAVDNTISGNTFDNATQRAVYLEGASIRNNIIGNTIINNPNKGIEILATANNNSIYNNNFFNNSVHAYDANGFNLWNATYSQSPLMGGNYWDNYTGLDEFHGPLQNIAGGDLIGDTNYTWIDGGKYANDSYPLMEPYGGIPPVSSVNATSAWHNSAALISAAASDVGSGVANVSLWYRFSADGSTWGAWTNYGLNNTGSWSWNFTFPGGDGYYEFYSIAVDKAGYQESAPASADQNSGYDTGSPTSALDAVQNYLQPTSPLTINGTASDSLSGVAGVTLWYRFSTDNSTWGAWTSSVTDATANYSWSFNFPDGGGYYEFYSMASDTAGNDEAAPASADTACRFDNVLPMSSIDALPSYWLNHSPTVITANATDDSGTVASVALHYQYSADNATWGSWTVFGTDTAAPWSWSFDFPDGQGYYRFYSVAVDGTGNAEPDATIADEACGYDSIAPTSNLVQPANYWWNGNISSNVLSAGWNYSDSLSGVENGVMYYQHSTDNNTWSGWNTGSTFLMGQGYYRFCSRAFDRAGNWEDYPATADVTLAHDSAAPAILDGTAANVTAGQSFTFTATVTDNMALKGVQIFYNLDGNQTNVTMALVSGSYQLTVTIPDGTHSLSYRLMAYDQAGNWQVLTEKSVTIDQPVPNDNPQEFPWMIVVLVLVISMAAVLLFLFMRKKPEQMLEKMDQEDGYENSDDVEEEAEEDSEELAESIPEEIIE